MKCSATKRGQNDMDRRRPGRRGARARQAKAPRPCDRSAMRRLSLILSRRELLDGGEREPKRADGIAGRHSRHASTLAIASVWARTFLQAISIAWSCVGVSSHSSRSTSSVVVPTNPWESVMKCLLNIPYWLAWKIICLPLPLTVARRPSAPEYGPSQEGP